MNSNKAKKSKLAIAVCKLEYDAKRRGRSKKSSKKLKKKYTISMGVHRKENLVFLKKNFIYISMGVHRKEILIL